MSSSFQKIRVTVLSCFPVETLGLKFYISLEVELIFVQTQKVIQAGFCLVSAAMHRILGPQPGIEPAPSMLEVQLLDFCYWTTGYWTAREVPGLVFVLPLERDDLFKCWALGKAGLPVECGVKDVGFFQATLGQLHTLALYLLDLGGVVPSSA